MKNPPTCEAKIRESVCVAPGPRQYGIWNVSGGAGIVPYSGGAPPCHITLTSPYIRLFYV